MAHIHELIRQLRASNPALGDEIAHEVELLAKRRAFGLNFERHTPEAVELPTRRLRVGDSVRILPPRGQNPKADDARLWRIASFTAEGESRIAHLVGPSPEEDHSTLQVSADELVFVSEFRDPIYPGLMSTGKVERGADKPFHTVIKAENYHALQALLYTHRGKVDAIYIDPPYNTGNDGWIYNDDYVSNDDMYRHSKWLAFMERRLLLAKELLAQTGVIIVAIGDEEHHRLRMLMDQIFSARNFIVNVTWQGGVSALAKHHGGGADYMLIYGLDAPAVGQFRDPKPFAPEMLALVRQSLSTGASPGEAQDALKAFIKSKKGDIAPGLAIFNKVDDEGNIYLEGDLGNSLPRPNLRYPIVNPETGRSYEPPTNGWEVSKEKMDALIAEGRIIFGNRNVPARKKLLSEQMDQLPAPSFYKDRRSASQRLRRMLGGDRFPNSKDPDVVARWLRMVAPRDGVILDFFAGSGTTAEAVARLNSEDGGTRRSVLVTNNEVASSEAKRLRIDGYRPGDHEWDGRGVYEYVTKPRIIAAVTGRSVNGTVISDGFNENIEFFTLTYETPMRIQSHREFARIAPLLWLRAGSRGRRIEELPAGWDVADTYGVIHDVDKTDAFVAAMADNRDATTAFIVTDEDRFFEAIANSLPSEVEVVRLYDSYLRNFEIDAMRGVR